MNAVKCTRCCGMHAQQANASCGAWALPEPSAQREPSARTSIWIRWAAISQPLPLFIQAFTGACCSVSCTAPADIPHDLQGDLSCKPRDMDLEPHEALSYTTNPASSAH